jgi:hypothetical protein
MPLDLNQGTSFNPMQYDRDNGRTTGVFTAGALKVVEENGTLVKLTNVSSPLDKPTNAKVSNTRIANVYQTLAKGAIPVAAQAVNSSGQAIFVELNVVASDPAAPNILVPMQSRLELKLPNHSGLTEEVVDRLVFETLALLADQTGYFRVTEMMRGILSLED